MKLVKHLIIALCLIALPTFTASAKRIVVAYVTSGSTVKPDPTVMTHINYAFGHVNKTFDGIRVDNPDRLKEIVSLKQQNPDLKIQISIGGWGSGRFSEMAADKKLREAFAKDCARVMKEFGIDGIDIDWEYPSQGRGAGISWSYFDTDNYTLLMRDIRKAIGKDALLTLASSHSARFINFRDIYQYIDFVNIMSYDMSPAPLFHNALYKTKFSRASAAEAVQHHLDAGLTKDKITMGLPFYGRGANGYPDYVNFGDIDWNDPTIIHCWDEDGKVPYMIKNGHIVCTYENLKSLEIKLDYIIEQDLLGGMYWEYTCDNKEGDMRNLVAKKLIKE